MASNKEVELHDLHVEVEGNPPQLGYTMSADGKVLFREIRSESIGNDSNDTQSLDEDDALFELFKEAMGEAKEAEAIFQRRIFRVIVACALTLILIIVATLSGISYTKLEHKKLKFGDDSVITFNTDSCVILFQHYDSFEFVDPVRLDLDSKSYAVVVSTQYDWDIDISISQDDQKNLFVSVKNHKELYEKYVDYFCNIYFLVPDGKTIPTTIVNAEGYLQTQVSSWSQTWGANSLSVNVKHPANAHLKVYLEDSSLGALNVTMGSGAVFLQSSTIQDDSVITATDADIYLQLENDIVLNTNVANSALCLSGGAVTCEANSTTNATQCSSFFVSSSNTTSSSSSPQFDVTCNTTCFINTARVGENEGNIIFAGSASSSIGFSVNAAKLLKDAFSKVPTRDQVIVDIMAPGAPIGRWMWSNRALFVVFPPEYLDVFSLYLLGAVKSEVNLTLTPAFCPGTSYDVSLDELVAIDALLKKTYTTTPSPDSLYVFKTDLGSINEESYQVKQDPHSGDYYVDSPGFNRNYDLLTILIINIVLALISTGYVVWIIIKKYLCWTRSRLDTWGALYFGAEAWSTPNTKLRARMRRKAGVFFYSEFLVGFPKEKRGYVKMALTVLVHFIIIIIMVAPLLTACLIYHFSSLENSLRFPVLSGIGYAWIGIYFVINFVYLTLYYLELENQVMDLTVVVSDVAHFIMLLLDVLYIVNVSYWIFLGALIKPSKILPFASVALVFFGHGTATLRRVRTLNDSLEEEMQTQRNKKKKKREEKPKPQNSNNTNNSAAPVPSPAPTPAPAPATPEYHLFKGNLTLTESLNILKESDILELKDATLREQIFTEIVIFVVLVLFFLFMLFGYTKLSPTDDVTAAINSVLIFVVGGGVNIPLTVNNSVERTKIWEKRIIAQAEAERKSKKKVV